MVYLLEIFFICLFLFFIVQFRSIWKVQNSKDCWGKKRMPEVKQVELPESSTNRWDGRARSAANLIFEQVYGFIRFFLFKKGFIIYNMKTNFCRADLFQGLFFYRVS